MDQDFIAKIKLRLESEKERVESKLAKLTAPETGEVNPDWDDTATDAIQNVEEESLLRIYRDLKERVDTALKKIASGAYGRCHECQQEIPQENLEKEPWAEHCSVICAKGHRG